MDKKESKPTLKNTPFTSEKLTEFRELYIFLLALGRAEEEALKMVERAVRGYYGLRSEEQIL